MKLTYETLTKYPNARVMYDGNKCAILALYTVSKTADICFLDRKNTGSIRVNISSCQLILTPVDRISDDDAVEVAKMCGATFAVDDIGRAKAGKDLLQNYLYRTSNVRGADWFKVQDYLRSKSYDIDNNIAAGVAVEKTEQVCD